MRANRELLPCEVRADFAKRGRIALTTLVELCQPQDTARRAGAKVYRLCHMEAGDADGACDTFD